MLVIGAGGLGSPALLYLAAAGVGTIGVIDDDMVENSNLQRQVIHRDARYRQAEGAFGQEAMQAQNPPWYGAALSAPAERRNRRRTVRRV